MLITLSSAHVWVKTFTIFFSKSDQVARFSRHVRPPHWCRYSSFLRRIHTPHAEEAPHWIDRRRPLQRITASPNRPLSSTIILVSIFPQKAEHDGSGYLKDDKGDERLIELTEELGNRTPWSQAIKKITRPVELRKRRRNISLNGGDDRSEAAKTSDLTWVAMRKNSHGHFHLSNALDQQWSRGKEKNPWG